MAEASNTYAKTIRGLAADLAADPTVYKSDVILSPIDTANAGKHKLCDGVKTYAQLTFIEDGGGSSGLSQDVIDSLVASESNAYPPTSINPYVTGDDVGNELALRLLASNNLSDVASAASARANLGLPSVWVADCLDFLDPGANTTVLKTQLGTITISSNGTGDYTITSTAQFTTATTILLIFSTTDAGGGLHFGADFLSSSTINVVVTDKDGGPIDPSGTTRIVINAYPA